jgi:hypothetical protein
MTPIPPRGRLALKMALTDLLKTITVENGYRHDLSSGVFRGKVTLSRESMKLPLVTINENVTKGSDMVWNAQDEGLVISDYPLVIIGYADPGLDPDNPTDAADLLFDDVMSCLGAVKPALANRRYLGLNFVDQAGAGLRVIHPPGNDESGLPYFAIEWRIRMAETFYGPPGRTEV